MFRPEVSAGVEPGTVDSGNRAFSRRWHRSCPFGAPRVGGKMAQQPQPYLGLRARSTENIEDDFRHLVAHHCLLGDAKRSEERGGSLEGIGVKSGSFEPGSLESVSVESVKGECSEGRGASLQSRLLRSLDLAVIAAAVVTAAAAFGLPATPAAPGAAIVFRGAGTADECRGCRDEYSDPVRGCCVHGGR